MASTIFILIALTIILLSGIHCDVQFQYDNEQCLNQPVEYQCTVTGSGTNILIWRVYTNNGTQIGSDVTYVSSANEAPDTIGGVFTVERISISPLISNISFTVQSSINGYTIICVDGINTLDNESITINIIKDPPPPPPMNISLSIDKSKLSATWTPPSFSQCVSSYSITSNATISTINATDTSVDIPLAGLSPGVYCVSVATVDTANKAGVYSNEECLELLALPSPKYYFYELSAAESQDAIAIVIVSLTYTLTSSVPVVTGGYAVLSTNDSTEEFKGSLSPGDNQTNITFSLTLKRGVNYSITCFGENVLGNGSVVTFNIYFNQSQVMSTPSMPHMSSTIFPSSDFMSFTFISVSPSPMCNTTDECDEYVDGECENMCEEGTSSTGGGYVLIIVVICIICAVIIIIIIILVVSVIVCYKKKKFQNCGVKPADEEKDNRPTDPTPATQPSKISSHDDAFSNKTKKSLSNEKSVSSKKKKVDSPPKPDPYRGKSHQVSYSSGKQEIHYAEMNHHSQKPRQHGGRGGGGGKAMSPPPMQSVVYSAIKPHH